MDDDTPPPYFLWWTDVSESQFREYLRDADADRRAYWLGALLREAHTRDVWRYTTPAEVRSQWPRVIRHLGRSRSMWAWLLQIDSRASSWPPSTAA